MVMVVRLVVSGKLFVVVMVEVIGTTWYIVSVSGNGGCGASDRGSGCTWEISIIYCGDSGSSKSGV